MHKKNLFKESYFREEHSLIETHCHLDYLKEYQLEDILEASRRQGVEKIITISVSPDSFEKVIALTEKDPMIYGTLGIHPHDAKYWNDEVRQELKNNIEACLKKQQSKIVAIGEIGLDYHYNLSDKKEQKQAFQEQLEMALTYNLPVVIHSRDADEDMMEILSSFFPQGLKGVIHSFTSTATLAEMALDGGLYLGFNGIITFKNAENVREIVRMTPEKRLLLETDAPYLAPHPFRGVENAPYYLPPIAEKLAALKETSVDLLLPIIKENSEHLFWK